MSFLNKLKDLDRAQSITLIKAGLETSEFLSAMESDPLVVARAMLQLKFFPNEMMKFFKESDALFELMEAHIEFSYTPDPLLINSMVSKESGAMEDVLKKAFDHFPSIPVTNEFIFLVIHNNHLGLAMKLISSRMKSEKGVMVAFFKALLQSDICAVIDDAFEETIIRHDHKEELLGLVLTGMKSEHVEVSPRMIKEIASNTKFSPEDVAILSTVPHDAKTLRKLHETSLKSASRSRSRYFKENEFPNNPRLRDIEWSEEVEKLNSRGSDKYLDIDVLNPPSDSKFYPFFIVRHPDMISDEEMTKFLKKPGIDTRHIGSVLSHVLSKGSLKLIKLIDFETVKEHVRISDIFDKIDFRKEVAEYLYEKLKDQYLKDKFLEYMDAKDDVMAFKKIIDANERREYKLIREVLETGYTIEKFVTEYLKVHEGPFSSRTDFSWSFLNSLTKEEFIFVIASDLRLFKYYSSEKTLDVPWRLSPSEIDEVMVSKLTPLNIFNHAQDKAEFISRFYFKIRDSGFVTFIEILEAEDNKKGLKALFDAAKSNEDLESLPSVKIGLFSKFDKKLGDNFFEALKEKRTLSNDDVLYLVENHTSKEIRENFNFDTIGFEAKSRTRTSMHMVDLKCKDGEYFIPDGNLLKYIVRNEFFENNSAISALFERNLEIFSILSGSYLKGIDEVYSSIGQYMSKHNIKRKQGGFNDSYKKLQDSLKKLGPDGIARARELFLSGAKLEQIKEEGLDLKGIYAACDMDIIFDCTEGGKYHDKDSSAFKVLRATKRMKIKVDGINLEDFDEYEFLSRTTFDSVTLRNWYFKDGQFLEKIMALSEHADLSKISFSLGSRYLETTLSYFKKLSDQGLKFSNHQAIIIFFTNLEEETIADSLTMELLVYLSENGMIFDDIKVLKILNSRCLTGDMAQFLSDRLGGLSRFTLDMSVHRNEESIYDKLEGLGVRVLDKEDFAMNLVFETLRAQGVEFDSVDVLKYSIAQKMTLIKFIEEEIDPEYKKINLCSKNLSAITIISSYTTIKESVTATSGDLIRIFSIPANLHSNKKLLSAIAEHISANPTLPAKVVVFKKMIVALIEAANLKLDAQKSYDMDDYLDKSGFGTGSSYIEENSDFERVPLWAIQSIIRAIDKINDSKVFMRGQDKKSIMRFLRSMSGHDESYLNDTLNMMKTVENGLVGFEDKRQELLANNGDQDHISNIEKTIVTCREVFPNVAKMDDISDMHDRMTSLAAAMAQDPGQPLLQSKYAPLEEDKRVVSETGVKLMFPKTRGDLIEIGNLHGWCVSGSTEYGDNVISNGNILVCLVPKSKESTVENVVALAHFINDPQKGYYLEQLRWSKLAVKNGNGNVDATNDFNHSDILRVIQDFIRKLPVQLERSAA